MENVQAAIRLEQIVKNYGKHEVLKGASLTVNKGDIYGLIGKNGSGKTTIFKIVLGLSDYRGGNLSIAGSANPKELIRNRRKIGFFVGSHFYPNLSAKENLKTIFSVINTVRC